MTTIYSEINALISEDNRNKLLMGLGVASILLGMVGGQRDIMMIAAISLISFIFLYSLYKMFNPELRITLTEDNLKIKYHPFNTHEIHPDNIKSVEHNPVSHVGGIGIKRLTDGTKSYRMYGEGVRINYDDTAIHVTSKHPQEFIKAIETVIEDR